MSKETERTPAVITRKYKTVLFTEGSGKVGESTRCYPKFPEILIYRANH